MIDYFSGYNQITVHDDDKEKTTFTTPWGTFMYDKMNFGLMNVGAILQKAMHFVFAGERDKFVVIYLDDLTMFSDSDQSHLNHLRQTFVKCRKYGLSLNPKKTHFAMQEGKLLDHIVSKDGVRIDPKRIEPIQIISLPKNKKEIHSFLGRINYLRRFMHNFVEIVKIITDMHKKNYEVKWNTKSRAYFDHIKKYLEEDLVLVSPIFSK
jgi:hypothetical protein